MNDIDRINALIDAQDFDARRRIKVVAQILRDLIADKEQGHENELAFTLVMAELAHD